MSAPETTHEQDLESGQRYEFGKNWAGYLQHLTEERIALAITSLTRNLGTDSLAGKTFLDVGCGSGLFSLAARKLGANVLSFDYDPASVDCARELKRRHFDQDPHWHIEEGSALDADYLAGLGRFDIVYSWGVLHHTGNQWRALDLVAGTVADGGRLFIALYNHQPYFSRYWLHTKRLYNRHRALRPILALFNGVFMMSPGIIKRTLFPRKDSRGMSYWYDFFDWMGGYPFETSRPENIFDFLKGRGFTLETLKTAGGGHGCNEFVFRGSAAPDEPSSRIRAQSLEQL